MGTNSIILLMALFLTVAFMSSAHAIQAIDPKVDTLAKARELVALDPSTEKARTNTVVATSGIAYTNCCQFKRIFNDSQMSYTLNLAGWGNTNQKKNQTIMDDIDCAHDLYNEMFDFELGEIPDHFICVPSYGALRDTFVTFTYSNMDPQRVISALNTADPGTEEWECTDSSLITDNSLLCKPQQLNISPCSM